MNSNSRIKINISNLHHNFNRISKYIGSSIKIIPIVKADAYGHGIVEISSELEHYDQVSYFGVAHANEGILLRKHGIKKNILAMSCINPYDIKNMHKFNITPVIHNIESLNAVIEYAKSINYTMDVHIKIDTGMARLGMNADSVMEIAEICKKNRKYINIKGLMSHFSDSESDDDWTYKQFIKFQNAAVFFEDSGFDVKCRHISNSGAIIKHKNMYLNCIRPGIILYGYMPSPDMDNVLGLKPVMSLESSIINIHNLKKGDGISYNRTFIAPRDMKIGVVAFGYADGLFRSLSNKMECIVNGRRCRVLGNICMDMFMCDISNADAKISDIVTIIGKDNTESVWADELAEKADTINYEILLNIGRGLRTKRVYIK